MNTRRLRLWIQKYGLVGLLMAGSVILAYEIGKKQQRWLLFLCLLMLFAFWIVTPAPSNLRMNDPFTQAIKDGNVMKVKSYLIAGTDPNHIGYDESNAPCVYAEAPALILALQAKQERVAQALIEAGADVHRSGSFGEPPIHLAAQRGYTNLVAMIMAKGVPVDEPDYTGETPLMHAAASGQTTTVQYLLERGANVKDNKGRIALSLTSDQVIRDLLIKAGAK